MQKKEINLGAARLGHFFSDLLPLFLPTSTLHVRRIEQLKGLNDCNETLEAPYIVRHVNRCVAVLRLQRRLGTARCSHNVRHRLLSRQEWTFGARRRGGILRCRCE